jgi:hypothetical protein
MRTLEIRPRQDRHTGCVACARHMRPETVPWMQHSIGCPVRVAALGAYRERTSPRSGRPATAPVSSLR